MRQTARDDDASSFSIWEWTCPPKIRWVPIVAMVLLAEPSAAQPVTPSQSAIIGWISCVADAAKRLAQGPDPAELVIKAALLACPDEKTNAIAEYQKKPHDNTLSPSMTESERNEAELSRTFAVIKQMDQIATQSATSAIAEARSGSRH
jgi:hypothetical protein